MLIIIAIINNNSNNNNNNVAIIIPQLLLDFDLCPTTHDKTQPNISPWHKRNKGVVIKRAR